MSTPAEEGVIIFVRASVMIYDDGAKRWIAAGHGGQNVESKVQLFHHSRACTYRIVARKGPEHEVVLNCPLYAAMKYNQTTATFHQWRNDQRQLHGLNFVSQEDAQRFGQAVCKAIETLSQAVGQQQGASQNGTCDHNQHNGLGGAASAPVLMRQQQQSSHYQQNHHYMAHAASVGDYGVQQPQYQHRGSQDDVQQQQIQNSNYQQQQANEAYYGVSPALHLQQHQRQPSAGSNASSSGSSACASQASNLIYSTVTPASIVPSPSRPAPPCPPPPPPMPASCKSAPVSAGSVPPAPPPPPPPANAAGSGSRQPMNLAQAISNQKLRKVPSGTTPSRPTEETGMSKDGRSASVGSVDVTMTTARAGSNSGFGGGTHSDVMSEMAATLARRRLLAESGGAASTGPTSGDPAHADTLPRPNEKGSEVKQKPWEARNGSRPSLNEAPSSSTDSPRTHRKVPSGSSLSSQEDVGLSLIASGTACAAAGVPHRSLSNGPTSAAAPFLVTAETLEQWKQEILNEVKREINKAKTEIIEGLKAELNRR